MATLTVSTDLVGVNCGECGGTYAICSNYHRQQKEEGGSWTCPYCKVGWGYSGRGKNAELRKKLLQQAAAHDQTRAALHNARELCRITESRRRAELGAKTKLKNRIANGVCPCCNRSFKQLAAHMRTQHPDWLQAND